MRIIYGEPNLIRTIIAMKKTLKSMLFACTTVVAMNACTGQKTSQELTASGLNPADFDTTYVDSIQGEKPVRLFTLKNDKGMEVCITNFGGRIVSIVVPDKEGKPTDVVLGFPTVAEYFPENNQSDFGSSVGRYANRIKDGLLPINGDTVRLARNNYGHCLHGGLHGWMYQVYDATQEDDRTLLLSLTAPDGENNFPGEVKVTVRMQLAEDSNALTITYSGQTDKPTVLNMTNHSYFNLNGDPAKPITNCIAQINADNFTPTDNTYMTTGEILPVAGTPFDFTQPKAIGKDFTGANPARELVAIENGEDHTGYDHNWVLNTYKDGKGDWTQVCATVYSPVTGIQLNVYTNEPGIQFYTGNFQNGTVIGKGGVAYPKNAAFCLETQKYPNAPQNPHWPSSHLNPGEQYQSVCIYEFTIHE